MKTWGPAFGLFVFALPFLAHAQVVINEVMYDPSGSNAGRQWVELYNAGSSSVSIVGGSGKGSWRVSDGSNHTLIDPESGTGRGSLTIPAGGYLVITSDPTTFIAEYPSGTYAVVKSSISLKSSGATIALVDGSGTTIDSFTYESAMGAGGDGTSLQKTAGGSWIAALPTPGAANAASAYTPSSSSQTSVSGTQGASRTQATAPVSSYVPPPTPDLYANAGLDRTVIAGADVQFDAGAYDKNQHALDASTVRFSWNFGDGSAAEGESVLHHFTYPGRYDVVLTIAQNKTAVADELIVTAEPPALALNLLPDNGVEIVNRAGHDLDLSNWIVKQDGGIFAAQFMLPDHSKILAGSSMKISTQTLQFRASSSTVLEYPNGTSALTIGQEEVQMQNGVELTRPLPVEEVYASAKRVHAAPAPEIQEPDSAPEPVQEDSSSTSAQVAAAAAAPGTNYLWWLGAVALAGAAGFAILAVAHFKKREWEIVEEMGE